MSTPPTAHNSVGSSTQGGNRNTAHETTPSMQLPTLSHGTRSNNQGSSTQKHWQVRPVARSVSSSSHPSLVNEPLTVNHESNGWIHISNDGSHPFPNFTHFNPAAGGAPGDKHFYAASNQWSIPPHAPGMRIEFNHDHNGPPMLHLPSHLTFPAPQVHSHSNQSLPESMPPTQRYPHSGGPVMEDDRSGCPHLPQAFNPNMFLQPVPQGPPLPSAFNGYPCDYGAYYSMPPPDVFPDFSFGFDTIRPPQGHPQHYPGPFPIINNGIMHPFGPPHNAISSGANPMGDLRQQHLGVGPDFIPLSPPMHYYPPALHMIGSSPPNQLPSQIPMLPRHWERSNLQNGHRPQGKFLTNKGFRKGYRSDMTPPVFPMTDRSGRMHNRSHTDSVNGQHRSNKRPPSTPRDTTPASPLLVKFRSTREQHWVFEQILGHIVEFSKDQYGSRFIQQTLEKADLEQKETIFSEIAPDHLNPLLRHVSGNYVIQKLLELGTQAQIDMITALIEEQAYELSLDTYGCRVVQKAIETVSKEHQRTIISKLEPHVFECVQHSNGNHVIQKLIEVVDPSLLTFLSCISDNLCEIAKHTYGCRVLQRCLEHLSVHYSKDILDAIHTHVVELMEDQYGNYVIQFIIQNGRVQDQMKIMESIQGGFINLARHKYASNVCEKALICADPDMRARMINEILKGDPTDFKQPSPLSVMVKDQYGNYVLQQAIRVAEGEQRRKLSLLLPPMLSFLQETTTNYSRSINSIDRLLGEEMVKCSI